MESTFNIPKDILKGIDIYNTIGGGISLTQEWISKENDFEILHIKTPGFNEKNYEVILKGNTLIVNRLISINEELVPFQSKNYPLSYFVKINEIKVQNEDGELQVYIPIDTELRNMERRLEIE